MQIVANLKILLGASGRHFDMKFSGEIQNKVNQNFA
jgi:hypothetical protein